VPPVITLRRKQISDWLDYELAQLREEMNTLEADGGDVDKEFFSSRVADIEKEALATYIPGMLEGTDARMDVHWRCGA
jgi:fatty acid synthase subunit alpha